jgi:hypothetical protein
MKIKTSTIHMILSGVWHVLGLIAFFRADDNRMLLLFILGAVMGLSSSIHRRWEIAAEKEEAK